VIIFVAAAFAGWSSVTHRTVGFDLDQDSVFGIDGKGDPTWTYSPPVPPFVIKTTDLDGNGRDEVVVTGPPTSPYHERPPADKRSYVTVLSADGELVTTAILEDLIGSWRFPYRVDVFPNISFEDLDGDGWNEIIATCHHHRFYPSALIVYWPKWDVWDVLLRHPGAFLGVAGAHENGRTGLRFVAHNNLLGMTKVYGEIDVIPPGSRPVSNRRTTSLVAPPEAMQRNATVGSWRTYIPFAPGHLTAFGDDRFVVESEPELVIGFATSGPAFDQFFNPIGGPNASLDLREARLQFAESLHLIGADTRAITRDGVEAQIESIRTDAGPLMNEVPYEFVFSTLAAKALAGVGDAEAGIALLEKTRHLQRDDDLLYRLAHLYAVHGEPEKAQAILRDTANNGTSSRAGFDVPVLMLQIAIAQRDENDVAAAIAYLTDRGVAPESTSGLRNSLAARARLWWDTATPTDAQVRTVDVDGDGDAVACLIRWRLGIPVPDDAERMRVSIDLNPDGFNLGTIALAAALFAQGRPDEAIGELDRVIGAIARSSRWDFTDSEILKLAQAVRVVALETTGDTAGAAAEARRLAPQFDADLLPGKLVHEVLDRTNS
jgi:hypothetical protein